MTRPLPIAYRSLGVLVGSFFLSASAGCINPKDDYADFARRPLTEHDAGFADVELTPCEQLLKEDLTGSYHTSCRPRDVPIMVSWCSSVSRCLSNTDVISSPAWWDEFRRGSAGFAPGAATG